MDHDPFKEYIKDLEPGKLERGRIWNTAIGLQDVDGLKPSKYLVDAAIGNIEGKLSLDEVRNLVDSYYVERKDVGSGEERTEEADKVSSRIAEILSEAAFSFTSNEYLSIHRRLFNGIYDHAGRIRDYNITKKEWVLNGASVLYGNALDLRETLEYDLSQERAFSYKGLTMDEVIHHLSVFVSRLWQMHVFCEGNTRTTAVFFIKYLCTLGFSAANDVFADNAWYFRNSLVRANYTDIRKDVHATTEYLEAFLRNLLLGEDLPLHNRNLNIEWPFDVGKVDIECSKVDIGRLSGSIDGLSRRTMSNVEKLFDEMGPSTVFGRGTVMEVLGLKKSSASKLLSNLLKIGVIEPVKGHGKGRYRFKPTVRRDVTG